MYPHGNGDTKDCWDASRPEGVPPGGASNFVPASPGTPAHLPDRGWPARRIAAILAAIVIILLPALVLIAAWVAVNAGALNGMLERRLGEGLGGMWRVGSVRTSGLSGLDISDLVWESPDGGEPAARFPIARVRWSVPGLLRGEIDGIYFERPEVSIRKLADGGYNIRIPESGEPMRVVLREAEASGGRLSFDDGTWRRRWVNVRLSLRDLAPGSLCSYRIEADTVFESGGKEEIRGRLLLRGAVDVDSLDFEPEYLLAMPEALDLDLAGDVLPKLREILPGIRHLSGLASIRGSMQKIGGGARPEFFVRLKDPRIEFDGWGMVPGDVVARLSGTWREYGRTVEIEDAEVEAEGIGRIRGSLTLDGRTWAPLRFRIPDARLDSAAVLAGLKIPDMEAIRIEGFLNLRDVEGIVSTGPAGASVRAAGTATWGPLLFEAPARGVSLGFRGGRANLELEDTKLRVRGLSASGLRGSQLLSLGRMACLLDLRQPGIIEVEDVAADLDLGSVLSHPAMLQFDVFRRSPLEGRGVVRLRSFSFRPAEQAKALEGQIEVEGTITFGRPPAAMQTPPLAASAMVSTDGNFSELSLSGISLDAAPAVRARDGRLDIRRGGDGTLKIGLSAGGIALDLESLCRILRSAEAGIAASGRVAIGKLEAADILGDAPSLSAALTFEGVSLGDPAGLLRLEGLDGSVAVSISGGRALVSGTFAPEAFSVAGRRFPLGSRPARVEITAAMSEGTWRFDRGRIEVRLPGLEDIAVDVRAMPAGGGKIGFEVAVACPKLRVADLRVEGTADPASGEVGPVRLRLPESTAADILAFLRGRGLDPCPGWKFDGKLKGEVELAPFAWKGTAAGKPWSAKGRVRLEVSGGKFESPDGNTMGDRVGVRLEAEGEGSSEGIGTLLAEAELTDAEVLIGGTFYLEKLPAGPMKVRIHARPGPSEAPHGGFRGVRLDVSAGRLGMLSAEGNLNFSPATGWGFRGRVGMAACDLGEVWAGLLAPNLKATHPTLAAMPLKGSLDAGGQVAIRRGAFSAEGKIVLREVSTRFESLEIGGVSGEIPFLLAAPPSAFGAILPPDVLTGRSGNVSSQGTIPSSRDADPRPAAVPGPGSATGKLMVRKFRYGFLAMDDQTLDFVRGINSLSVANEVVLRLPGGYVRISRLAANDMLLPDARLVFYADVPGLDLKELCSRLGLPPLDATVAGRITRGVLAAERGPFGGVTLAMEGGFDWEMFGGSFRLYDISISNMFTPAVTLGLSLDFINVDIEKLTSWPPIAGRIGSATGILAGSLRGLEICGREPSRFDLILRAEGRPGKPTVLDIRMAAKIIEATGGKAPAFLARMYGDKKLNYEQLGVQIVLENGKVTFIPLVNTPDHRSYIVKGGKSPALNVGATSNRMPWSWVRDIYLRQIGDAIGAVGGKGVSGASEAAGTSESAAGEEQVKEGTAP
ncbi:MAG: hypothetical protein N3A38_00865 [Planctomycetota bacterium]|nr:hypothetical protein [Planctomycetota bacterium]